MIVRNSTNLAVAALSAIAVLGMPEVAQASKECGLFEGTIQGTDWVSRCPAGVDIFPDSWAKILVDIPELFPEPFFVKLRGPATITRQAGDNGVIETRIDEVLTGGVHFIQIPGIGEITLTGTDGIGEITDLSTDRLGRTEYANGQPIIANDGYADSFFEVPSKIDVETPSGTLTLTSATPVLVVGDRPLIGVSPDMIIPPGPPDMALRPECFAPDGTPLAIPPIAIAYCGNTPIALLDENGIVRGTILAEVHTVHPVPEPSSTIAFMTAFGAIFGLKRKGKQNH